MEREKATFSELTIYRQKLKIIKSAGGMTKTFINFIGTDRAKIDRE